MHTLYTLTPLTGREASAARTVVIGTIEFNWRVWMILVWTSPVALLATALTWTLVGQYALIMLPLVEIAALWLIHARSRTGLKLRTYQAINDKRRSTLNEFFLCGNKINLRRDDYRVLSQNTAPARPAEAAPATALVDQFTERSAPDAADETPSSPDAETAPAVDPEIDVPDLIVDEDLPEPVTPPTPPPAAAPDPATPAPAPTVPAAPAEQAHHPAPARPAPQYDDEAAAWFDIDDEQDDPMLASTPTWRGR